MNVNPRPLVPAGTVTSVDEYERMDPDRKDALRKDIVAGIVADSRLCKPVPDTETLGLLPACPPLSSDATGAADTHRI